MTQLPDHIIPPELDICPGQPMLRYRAKLNRRIGAVERSLQGLVILLARHECRSREKGQISPLLCRNLSKPRVEPAMLLREPDEKWVMVVDREDGVEVVEPAMAMCVYPA